MSTFRLLAVIVVASLLTSCGSQLYQITLKDGRQVVAKGKPELQKKTGYYQYENLQGRDGLVRADEVLIIEQQ